MRVRNIRTGVETEYPKRQAMWLIGIGKCEEVRPEKKPAVKTADSEKKSQTYQTKDLKADVAVPKKIAK